MEGLITDNINIILSDNDGFILQYDDLTFYPVVNKTEVFLSHGKMIKRVKELTTKKEASTEE